MKELKQAVSNGKQEWAHCGPRFSTTYGKWSNPWTFKVMYVYILWLQKATL